jgi:hypothetical protein
MVNDTYSLSNDLCAKVIDNYIIIFTCGHISQPLLILDKLDILKLADKIRQG